MGRKTARFQGLRNALTASVIIVAVSSADALDVPRPDLSTAGPWGTVLRLEATNMIRGEFVHWLDPGPGANDHYSYWGNRFQAGVRVTRNDFLRKTTNLEGFFQFQHTLIDEVPANAPGPGGVYRANTNDEFQQAAIFRQGWLKLASGIGGDTLTVTGGRTRFRDGTETQPTDPTLRWLKTNRIAERLLGPFDYTFAGRSFDGVTVGYDHANLNLTGFWQRPTTGGYEVSGGRSIDDIDVAGLSITASNPADREPTDARLFWVYYDDARDVLPFDNRGLAAPTPLSTDGLTLHTIGANAAHVFSIGPGALDVLAWAAGQLGDWQNQDQRAWAYDLEAGYRLTDVPWKPWLRAVFFRSSGDPDAGDDTHETFFQMLPTARIYAQTPFYNMMNNQDLFAQFILDPLKSVNLRTELHYLRATESADFVYAGGGATKDDFFGFSGFPASGKRDIGYFVDVALTWTPVEVLKFYAYYGHLFGADTVRASFDNDDLNYGYVEMTVSF
jgi:hypothetical protein